MQIYMLIYQQIVAISNIFYSYNNVYS